MDISITLHETIGISEHVKAETEIDAIIYRQEFERHRAEYLKTKIDSELILTFIFLQIYSECFLHQNMRKIVEFEFKPPRDGVYTTWLKGEKRYVPEKIDNIASLFFTSVPDRARQLANIIKDRLGNISYIRNQFIHGHKVAAWSGSDGSGSTPTKLLLTENQLNQSISEINELISAWNELLDNILPNCKSLRRVDDFKISSLY